MSDTTTITKPNPVQATPERLVEPRYQSRQIDEHNWELSVVVPGVKREDVTISLEDRELEIVARRRDSRPESWKPLHAAADRPDGYRLDLSLGIEVDPDRITAKLADGILTLRLPVAESAKPKRIAVE